MTNDDTTVQSLQSHIRELEHEVVETKRLINSLLVRRGQPAAYADTSLNGDVGNIAAIRTDQFYGQPLATAVRDYLKMRRVANRGPATVDEIYDALCRGGYAFETENEGYRKKNLRVSLTKNSSLFHRLPNGTHYGLPDWYEEVAKRTEDPRPKIKKSKRRAAGRAKKADVGPKLLTYSPPTESDSGGAGAGHNPKGKPTAIKAVQEAVAAMDKEFTKQDVVDWIEKQYPDLKAKQRKTSIFSMMGNLKGDLKLVTSRVGKGTEPHRYRRADEANGEAKKMN